MPSTSTLKPSPSQTRSQERAENLFPLKLLMRRWPNLLLRLALAPNSRLHELFTKV